MATGLLSSGARGLCTRPSVNPAWEGAERYCPVLQTGKLADLGVPEERTLTFQGLFETPGDALQGSLGSQRGPCKLTPLLPQGLWKGRVGVSL